MKASLILNESNEIAFMYGERLGFEPEWASIDVQHHELYIGAGDDYEDYGKHLKLDKIEQEIYDKILKDKKILLVRVKNNDIRQPQQAKWVPLMITQQLS